MDFFNHRGRVSKITSISGDFSFLEGKCKTAGLPPASPSTHDASIMGGGLLGNFSVIGQDQQPSLWGACAQPMLASAKTRPSQGIFTFLTKMSGISPQWDGIAILLRNL